MGDRQSHQYQAYAYQQKQSQEEALIKFYIYQDLQNLINLIYSRNAVLEHFKDDPNNSIVTLSNNKVILQLNLSSGIHQDLQQQYSKSNLSSKLSEERQKAFKTLQEVTSQQGSQVGNQNQNKAQGKDQIEEYLKIFTQNYEYGSFRLNQFQLQQTNYVPQFNEQTLSNLISQMQSIDAQTNQVGTNGNYQAPTPGQIIQRAKEYYSMTKQKLIQSDPTNRSAQLNNNQSQSNKNSLPQNKIAGQQQFSPSNSSQKQQNNKQECLINEDQLQTQQSSQIANEMWFNDKQVSSSQGNESHIADIRRNHDSSNSSHNEQEKIFITSVENIEKEELILFFEYLGYFLGKQPFFVKEVKDLVTQANQIIEKQSISYTEKNLVNEIQKYTGDFQNLVQIHYYFELFFDYCKEKRPIKNQESIRKFVTDSKNIGQITPRFFTYLISKKEVIKRNLPLKASINRSNNQEDYIWQMYKGYCEHYIHIQKQ